MVQRETRGMPRAHSRGERHEAPCTACQLQREQTLELHGPRAGGGTAAALVGVVVVVAAAAATNTVRGG